MYILQHWLQNFTLLTLAPPVKYVKLTLTTLLSDHLWTIAPGRRSLVRLNTSALVGDPDPYPRVFQIQNAIPGSVRVSATR